MILKKLISQQEWYTFVFFKKWKNLFWVDTLRKKHKSFRKHTISWLFPEIQKFRLPPDFCVLMHSTVTINGILLFLGKHEVAWAQRVQQNFQTLKSRFIVRGLWFDSVSCVRVYCMMKMLNVKISIQPQIFIHQKPWQNWTIIIVLSFQSIQKLHPSAALDEPLPTQDSEIV